jgi:hypothetical protein
MIDQTKPQPSAYDNQEKERLLDEALEESFPASDPISSLDAALPPALREGDHG